jgi:hypothetical protein
MSSARELKLIVSVDEHVVEPAPVRPLADGQGSVAQ